MNISTIFLVCLCLCVTLEMAMTSEVTDPVEQFRLHCLTPDSWEVNDICIFFRTQDSDVSGSLNWLEFWFILRHNLFIEEEEADAMFKLIDIDGSGTIDFGEFLTIARSPM
ncbi:calcyphosin-like protein [Solea solea]|uniref:calcyphosin-like protein n=1 Tax=Solea solea TaxID=90069 RepID=UPI0027295382|nr:calcyphosin-like protein [Solea solea]